MLTHSASTQKFSISFPLKSLQQLVAPARSRRRFATLSAMSFAVALPALGVIDPAVIHTASLADVQRVNAVLAHAEAALSNMNVLELFATGSAAALAFAAMCAVGYLRVRHKAMRAQSHTAD